MRLEPPLFQAAGVLISKGVGVCWLESNRIGSVELGIWAPETKATNSTKHKSNWPMQHIDFPQVVNTEPLTEVEAYFVYGLTSGKNPLSLKQASWLVGVARLMDWDPQGIAYALAVATRGGPDLKPFEASDDELNQEASRIYDEGIAAYLRVTGGLQ